LIHTDNGIDVCDSIVAQLQSDLDEIIENHQYIFPSEIKNRRKRGLLNIVGYGMKTLFGTLGPADEEKYSNLFSKLQEKTKHLELSTDTHTTILETNLLKLNETISTVNTHSGIITNLSYQIDILKKSEKNTNNYVRVHNMFEELSQFTSLILSKIRRDQIKIFDIINSARRGLIHESLFNPQTIYEELVSAQVSLYGLHFPLPLKKHEIYKIIGLSSFNAAIFEKIIIFEISTPLIKEEIFTFYNVISIPKLNAHNTFIFIKPEFETFLMDTDQKLYMPLTKESFDKNCKLLFHQRFICEVKNSMFFAQNRRSCETSILIKSRIDKSLCQEVEVTLKNQLWITLSELNSYILISPKPTTIGLRCDGNTKDITLREISLIKTNCSIYSESIRITPTISFKSSPNLIKFRHISPVPDKLPSGNDQSMVVNENSTPLLEHIKNINFTNRFKKEEYYVEGPFPFVITITTIIIIFAVALLYVFAFWLYTKGVKATKQRQQSNEEGHSS
jgi:hypothetical protein